MTTGSPASAQRLSQLCAPHVFSCHEQEPPPFAEAELNRLYGARYACMAHFRIYGHLARASTYVARRGGPAGQVAALFLFHRRRRRVAVLNEGIRVGAEQASAFAADVFARYPAADAVAFRFVETDAQPVAFPCQRLACGEDNVMALPATVAAYLAGLGKSTKATLKHRINKLKRDFPSFQLSVYEKEAVPPAYVGEILRLNRTRMHRKDKVSSIDAREERCVTEFVKACGFVCVATIDGRVCGGAIMYRLGQNFSARILAHEPAYDTHRLGFVCAYLAIGACIEAAGAGTFYFGWGQSEYKYRLGAQARELSYLVLYRSRLHMLRQAGAAMGWWARSLAFRCVRRVRRGARGERTLGAYVAGRVVRAGRWLRAALHPTGC
ncbi:MAG: GNAT family N-acetyltransferase [Pseudomonadota bacterium]